MSLPSFAVHNTVAANLLMVAILLVGTAAAAFSVREFFPTFDTDQITITVVYPGGTPEETDLLVTRQIERTLGGLDGVDEVTSTVLEGISRTNVKVLEGADSEVVLGEVRTRVDQVVPQLPEIAEEPVVDRVRPYIPVITVVVYGDSGEGAVHSAALSIRDDLLKESGISRVVTMGLRDREILVTVDPLKLEEWGLTFSQVGQLLAARNADVPGGQLETDRGNLRVRLSSQSDEVESLKKLVILGGSTGRRVLLQDIATVAAGFEDRIQGGRFKGKRAAFLTVFKSPEQDALAIAGATKKYVESHRTAFGAGIQLDTVTDLARLIQQRLDLLTDNGLQGLILVLLALALFLDLRVAFWVALGLPVSFLGTLILMKALGVSINMISMFGLIVVLGLIVDDAIVIAENIFQKIREGMPGKQAAIEGANQVLMPVTAAVTTTIAAFTPLGFIGGRVGTFLKELPLVVICALVVSLIEAFIILPAHLCHGAPNLKKRKGILGVLQRFGEWRLRFFETTLPDFAGYFIALGTRFRYVTLALLVALTIGASGILAGGIVPFVLLQETDAESIQINLEMAAGTLENQTEAVVDQIEALIAKQPETRKVFTVLGSSLSDEGPELAADPATIAQITVELMPSEERQATGGRSSQELSDDLRRLTQGIPGVSRLRVASQSGGPSGRDLELRLRGEDPEILVAALHDVEEQARSFDGLTVETDLNLGKLEAHIKPRPIIDAMSLSPTDLAMTVRHALFGFEAQALQREDEEVKVRVLLPEKNRRTLESLGRLRVPTPMGGRAPLSELVDFEMQRGDSVLKRADGQRSLSIMGDVDKSVANVANITAELTRYCETNLREKFPGVGYSFEGMKKETQESMGSLRYLFPAALFLIYAVIAILFRSYLQPLVVMAVIPFSLIGAVLGHWIMGYPFTLLSMIGIVALAGVVVNDSLVLVSYVNLRRREGLTAELAAVEGSKRRLRAILLTSVTTICGLAPLLFEKSFQAQFLIPMAVSLVFGLLVGTVLVPILVPCLYMIIEDLRRLYRRVAYRA